jgi:alginate O-acetyltransferase complex protein AlgI
MLFSSYEFLLIFLPITIIGFYLLAARQKHRLAIAWLTLASLLFYGWWNPVYLPLIGSSIAFNYLVCGRLVAQGPRRTFLVLGIAGNVVLLGYFKYANFFVMNVAAVSGVDWTIEKVVLPLAISFFTFQQIAYLIDSYQTRTRENDLLRYSLFVCFFPQLIAGPIVHHREMLPQIEQLGRTRFEPSTFALGLSVLIVGLAKKVLIADGISVYATPVFDTAATGAGVAMSTAWIASFAYTFQLYFDFSGYSDMALGLGILFGVRLPLNFNSPLKSDSMIEFWRRWHMTLSRFLQDYLFLPFSMNEMRRGWTAQPVFSFVLTMSLGGLWHGANWTFVIWGVVQGVMLAINQTWRTMRRSGGSRKASRLITIVSVAFTFLCWSLSLIIFRSVDLDTALVMYKSMAGMYSPSSADLSAELWQVGPLLVCLSAIIWVAPNISQLFAGHDISTGSPQQLKWLHPGLTWRPNVLWAIILASIATISLLNMNSVNEFLYFQF